MNFLVHESENSMFFSRAPYVYFYGWQATNKILVAYLIKKTLPNGLAHHIKQNLKQKSWNDDWATFACGSVSSSLYSFNPETSEFVTLPDMPRERYRHASVASNNQVEISQRVHTLRLLQSFTRTFIDPYCLVR